jgi:hypothetical protein
MSDNLRDKITNCIFDLRNQNSSYLFCLNIKQNKEEDSKEYDLPLDIYEGILNGLLKQTEGQKRLREFFDGK